MYFFHPQPHILPFPSPSFPIPLPTLWSRGKIQNILQVVCGSITYWLNLHLVYLHMQSNTFQCVLLLSMLFEYAANTSEYWARSELPQLAEVSGSASQPMQGCPHSTPTPAHWGLRGWLGQKGALVQGKLAGSLHNEAPSCLSQHVLLQSKKPCSRILSVFIGTILLWS